MNSETIYFEQLESLVDSFPPDSILSRTIFQDDSIKTILFGFHPGQELSEHTAAVPALLHFIKGEAELVLGDDARTAQAGTWVRIPPQLPHSIHAKTTTLMLLYLLLD
ncbi:MAG: cupin domain-containing protein [Anaerolineales bacterium]|nr:cupin domain-containing protein [Anaerolineales bacterium]